MSMDMDSDDSLTSYWSSGSSERGFVDGITTSVGEFIPQQRYNVEAERELLRGRLQLDAGRIVRDPEMIAQRLHVDEVDEGFI
ncbi:hypothetical protein BDN71DRAFT_1185573 [Pleurotus eryngii]|uniref:Uncharacterized protein n=1 Tax=Pleurotus eryngii TaxID=5323 RepID=A0A9P6A6U6_PLEER|nr:hypothetical protein BDN71DRAFT_1185573 [Pleurotus eryngii]